MTQESPTLLPRRSDPSHLQRKKVVLVFSPLVLPLPWWSHSEKSTVASLCPPPPLPVSARLPRILPMHTNTNSKVGTVVFPQRTEAWKTRPESRRTRPRRSTWLPCPPSSSRTTSSCTTGASRTGWTSTTNRDNSNNSSNNRVTTLGTTILTTSRATCPTTRTCNRTWPTPTLLLLRSTPVFLQLLLFQTRCKNHPPSREVTTATAPTALPRLLLLLLQLWPWLWSRRNRLTPLPVPRL